VETNVNRANRHLSDRLRLGIVVLGLIAAMVFSYYAIIDPLEYSGYFFEIRSLPSFALGVVLAVLPVAYLPLTDQRPSLLITYLLYFLAYIPACTIPYCTGHVEAESMWVFHLTLAVSFWIVSVASRLPILAVPHQALPKPIFWAVIIGLFTTAWSAVLLNYGFHLQWVVLDDVYDVRADFVDSLAVQSRALVYLVPWLVNVIAPFLFVYAIRNRQWPIVGLVAFSQVLAYTITAYKHILFSTGFLLLLYCVLRMKRGSLIGRMAMACFGMVVACAAIDLMTDNAFWTSIGTRRIFLNAGILTGFYFDFFSINPKFHLSHSILRYFLTSPYSTVAPMLVGETYIGPGCHANAHVWADSFANFGLLGMLVFSGGLMAILWFYDCISRGCDRIFAALVLAIPAMVLANTALLTTLLTHGLGLVVALMFFSPREFIAHRERYEPGTLPGTPPRPAMFRKPGLANRLSQRKPLRLQPK
jgi:hypothetical protein